MRAARAALAGAVAAAALALPAAPAWASGGGAPPLPPLPSLPSLPGGPEAQPGPLPALPPLRPADLGQPGSLDPQIAAWSQAFAKESSADVAEAAAGLGAAGAQAGFASLWASAEQAAAQAGSQAPSESLPGASALERSLGEIGGPVAPAIADMALPSLPMPSLVAPAMPPGFGQAMAEAAAGLPQAGRLEVNPDYSWGKLLAAIGGGCQPSGQGCAFGADPSQMLAVMETQAMARGGPAALLGTLEGLAPGAQAAERLRQVEEQAAQAPGGWQALQGQLGGDASSLSKAQAQAEEAFAAATRAIYKGEHPTVGGDLKNAVAKGPAGFPLEVFSAVNHWLSHHRPLFSYVIP